MKAGLQGPAFFVPMLRRDLLATAAEDSAKPGAPAAERPGITVGYFSTSL